MRGQLNEIGTGVLLIVALVACAVVAGIELYEKHANKEVYPEDNYVEEMAEQVVESSTGMDLDLSPLSPEKR